MKKTNFFLIGGMALVLSLSSCNRNKDGAEDDPFKLPNSSNSIEADKAVVEESGIDFVNEVGSMKNSTAVELCANFSDLSSNEVVNGPGILMAPVEIIAGVEKSSPSDIFSQLKSVSANPESFEDAWNQLVGTYTWNFSNSNWDYQSGGSTIVIEFPGKDTDVTNTAVYTVSNLSVQDIDFPEFENETGMKAQVPTSLKFDLKYNGTSVSTYELTATYQTNGIPTYLKTTLTIDEFSFVSELTNEASAKASEKYQFKKGSNVLVEAYVEAKGDWSDENIKAHIIEHNDFDYIDMETGDSIFYNWTEVEPEYIVNNANAYFQVMNIKVAALVNVENLVIEIKKIDEQWTDENNDESMVKLADLFNKEADLVLVNTETNTKLSTAEAYTYDYTGDFETYKELGIRFVFGDGSKVDAETYFSDGFGGFIDAVNNLAMDVANNYDMNYSPIEY